MVHGDGNVLDTGPFLVALLAHAYDMSRCGSFMMLASLHEPNGGLRSRISWHTPLRGPSCAGKGFIFDVSA